MFKSTDSGQNWSFVQSLSTASFTRTVGIKPDDPGFVFIGNVGMVLTQNSGSSFISYNTGVWTGGASISIRTISIKYLQPSIRGRYR